MKFDKMIIKQGNSIFKIVVGLAAGLFCGSLLPIVVSIFFAQGQFEPSLSAHLAPTAQWLLNNPEPTPLFIESIEPLQDGFCIKIHQAFFGATGDREDFSLMAATRLLINGKRLAAEQATVSPNMLTMFEDKVSLTYSICVEIELPRGLHLFELQIRDHPLGQYDIGEVFSYQWAYEVR